MTDLTNRRAYLGAQNDAWFIIHGEPPAQSNDHPRHDADRVAIAKVLDEQACRRLAACWNVCQGFNTDVLESITTLGETMLTRFQARDRVEQVLIADRLKAMQERDQLRALVLQLRSALRDHEQAREAMFAQCGSNPVFGSWGRQVDMTLLNDAHQATERALRASEHVEPTLVRQVLEDIQPRRPPAPPAPERCMGGLPQCKWVDVPEGGSKCTACGDTLPF